MPTQLKADGTMIKWHELFVALFKANTWKLMQYTKTDIKLTLNDEYKKNLLQQLYLYFYIL